MVVRVKTVIVRFQPPETCGGLVSNIVNPVLNEFIHLLILDSDTVCDFSVDNIAKQFGVADIVGFNVISSSRTFRLWEKMTYWLKLSPHVRGCAMAQFPPSRIERSRGQVSVQAGAVEDVHHRPRKPDREAQDHLGRRQTSKGEGKVRTPTDE